MVFSADLCIPNITFVTVSRVPIKKYKKCSEDKEAAAGAPACEDLLGASCSVWDSLSAKLQSKSLQAPGRSVMRQTFALKKPCHVCLPVQKKE